MLLLISSEHSSIYLPSKMTNDPCFINDEYSIYSLETKTMKEIQKSSTIIRINVKDHERNAFSSTNHQNNSDT